MINSLKDIQNIYGTYFLLITIVIFVVAYFIINYSNLTKDNLFTGDYVKPILITGIILLLCTLFLSDTDNEQNNMDIDSVNSKIFHIMNDEEKLEQLNDLAEIKDSKISATNNEISRDGKLFRMMNDNKNNKNNKNRIIQEKEVSQSPQKESKKRRNVFLPYKDNTMKFALKT